MDASVRRKAGRPCRRIGVFAPPRGEHGSLKNMVGMSEKAVTSVDSDNTRPPILATPLHIDIATVTLRYKEQEQTYSIFARGCLWISERPPMHRCIITTTDSGTPREGQISDKATAA